VCQALPSVAHLALGAFWSRFTASHAILICKLDVQLTTGTVDFPAALQSMLGNWHYMSPSDQTAAAKDTRDSRNIGTRTEPKLFGLVAKDSDVEAVCDVGLLGRTDVPWMAASPDGLVLLRPDGWQPQHAGERCDHKDCTLAVMEIKTRVGAAAVRQAEALAAQGRRWRVTVPEAGDSGGAWKRLDDLLGGNTSHRMQIIHQATVCDVDTVLYVVGQASSLLYIVKVVVPASVRRAHLEAVQRVGLRFVAWYHECASTSGALADSAPDFVTEPQLRVMESHRNLWVATTSYVRQVGVLHPVKAFNTGSAADYSGKHSGVDQASKCVPCAAASIVPLDLCLTRCPTPRFPGA
jgi:hypothetical protein